MAKKKNIERWSFTKSELKSKKLSKLNSKDEFLATLYEPDENNPNELLPMENKIVIQRNGICTNRWDDGTVGVNKEQCEEAQSDESPFRFKDYDNLEPTEAWKNVIVDDKGFFVKFGKK